MVQDIDKYAKMAGSLGISASVLEQTQGIFEAVPEIMQDFSNPANELTAKHNVIDRVFPTEIRSFLKLTRMRSPCFRISAKHTATGRRSIRIM